MRQGSWLRVFHESLAVIGRIAASAFLCTGNLLDASAGLAGYVRAKNALRCQDENPDRCIEGCTSLIQSGLEHDKNMSIAFNNRGLAFGLRGSFDRAIQDFDQALKLTPNYAEAFRNRGEAYRRMGQYDLAIQDFDKALQLDPNHAQAFNGRGNAYESKGDLRRAIRDYAQAIRLNPDNDDALNNLAWLYATAADRTLRDPAKALQYARLAVALNDEGNADDLDTLAEAYYANRDYQNAILTENRALALQLDLATRLKFEGSLAKYERALKQSELCRENCVTAQNEIQYSIQ